MSEERKFTIQATQTITTKQTKPNKHNDDDWELFNPFKFMIGCFKVFFGIIKWIVENLLLRR